MTLSDSLQELLEHGYEGSRGMSYISCVPFHVSSYMQQYRGDCAAWRVLLHYYKMKVSIIITLVLIIVYRMVLKYVHSLHTDYHHLSIYLTTLQDLLRR